MLLAGFALGLNPMLVVTLAAFASLMAAGHGPIDVVRLLGHAFVANRFLAVAWLVLPMVGVLERAGLREQAAHLVGRLRGATAGRILLGYLALRQLAATIGLTALGGQAQMVRPILAPMAESAAARDGIDADGRALVRAHAAAADNIGVFFGEDVFVAVGSVLLVRAVMQQNHVAVEPIRVALWAVPTAIAAFILHGLRLLRLDHTLRKRTTRQQLGSKGSALGRVQGRRPWPCPPANKP